MWLTQYWGYSIPHTIGITVCACTGLAVLFCVHCWLRKLSSGTGQRREEGTGDSGLWSCNGQADSLAPLMSWRTSDGCSCSRSSLFSHPSFLVSPGIFHRLSSSVDPLPSSNPSLDTLIHPITPSPQTQPPVRDGQGDEKKEKEEEEWFLERYVGPEMIHVLLKAQRSTSSRVKKGLSDPTLPRLGGTTLGLDAAIAPLTLRALQSQLFLSCKGELDGTTTKEAEGTQDGAESLNKPERLDKPRTEHRDWGLDEDGEGDEDQGENQGENQEGGLALRVTQSVSRALGWIREAEGYLIHPDYDALEAVVGSYA
ncbi:uncharacterized protein LOC121559083 [Coregonus clupeaformis]|uniref:uncharacterized protein LOC121559083 n=1 Tax=Coregonus clupeaformis TaxID=59861 RepID=UPI001BDFF5DD|nr:uncharacterized protein LOC121559083 [Coregonus clupeaformis]